MKEFEHEPIPGLPERLPEGERILWQGAPAFRGLALGAFRMREVAFYFGLLGAAKAVSAAAAGAGFGAAALEFFGMIVPTLLALGVLAALAALCARSTVYTITTRRVVFRFGMALEKAVNLPFSVIESAAVKADRTNAGDIALALTPKARVSYLAFWPHVRPFRFGRAEPSMRGLPDVNAVAQILATALAEAQADAKARTTATQVRTNTTAAPPVEAAPPAVEPALSASAARLASPIGAPHPA